MSIILFMLISFLFVIFFPPKYINNEIEALSEMKSAV